MNKAVLIGRLTKDPEVRTTASGIKTASFTLAVDRNFKNSDGEREADFIPIVTWRGAADLTEKYLTKGKQVAVSGRIQTRNYEDKDGNRRFVTEVVADELQFLSSASSQSNNSGSTQQTQKEETSTSVQGQFTVPLDGFEEIDASMPF